MRFLKVICLFATFACAFSAKLQVVDSAKVHSVKKAAIFSAIIPGAGQVYNHLAMPKGKKKAFWKVPLIYASLGYTSYLCYQKNSEKNALRRELESIRAGNPSSPEYEQYDDYALSQLFTTARSRRDFLLLGVGIVYILNIMDAAVEAHFVDFDIGEKLTLHVQPQWAPKYYGMGIQLNIR